MNSPQEMDGIPIIGMACRFPGANTPATLKNETGLVAYAQKWHHFLASHPEIHIADLCYTARVSRSAFAHRFSVLTDTREDLQEKLAAFLAGSASTNISRKRVEQKPLVFLFTGQGSQYPGMAADLYRA